tara:strand:+ start:97 stop:345 length:249 start_codon:yes stop_codon:yes gene_type:complete
VISEYMDYLDSLSFVESVLFACIGGAVLGIVVPVFYYAFLSPESSQKNILHNIFDFLFTIAILPIFLIVLLIDNFFNLEETV